ncbi:hypothetical protein KFE25_012319 [Diacronema lutheri]|uniref:Uncharacterized protein n=1 Tax=Diacronema lutheri TaxID=2081491 RepID=A0A8J5XGU4_DIALT|nr:hypothetical protein KFE25_012319 [Diacronema lutheri]
MGAAALHDAVARLRAEKLVLERALRSEPAGDVRLELALSEEASVRLGVELAEVHERQAELERLLGEERAAAARAARDAQQLERRVSELSARAQEAEWAARDATARLRELEAGAARERAERESAAAHARDARDAREQRDAALDRVLDQAAELDALRGRMHTLDANLRLEMSLQIERGDAFERRAQCAENDARTARARADALDVRCRELVAQHEAQRAQLSETHAHAHDIEARMRSALARAELADEALVGVLDAREREAEERRRERAAASDVPTHVLAQRLSAALDELAGATREREWLRTELARSHMLGARPPPPSPPPREPRAGARARGWEAQFAGASADEPHAREAPTPPHARAQPPSPPGSPTRAATAGAPAWRPLAATERRAAPWPADWPAATSNAAAPPSAAGVGPLRADGGACAARVAAAAREPLVSPRLSPSGGSPLAPSRQSDERRAALDMFGR